MKSRKLRIWLRIGLILAVVLGLTVGIISGSMVWWHNTEQSHIHTYAQSITSLRLLAVDSTASSETVTESYWVRQDDPSFIIRCEHDREWFAEITLEPHNCTQIQYGLPSQIHEQAFLQSLNRGVNQVTQSIWLGADTKYFICDHDGSDSNLSNFIGSIKGCSVFATPQQVAFSHLAAFNSGTGLAAQLFWQDPIIAGGRVTVCTYPTKMGTTTFNTSPPDTFGGVPYCVNMPIPTNKFPRQLGNPQLRSVTGDEGIALESFWQDAKTGSVVRCVHNRIAITNGDDLIGSVVGCNYFMAPQFPS